ncbi:hypothetical protein NDU88_003731 [Pleurodeles waltl]|uniref:Uncharacterized protein n=1 Tax=Pleurodeles waltl TaxID=8319 RepID=A0AAV7LG14_PLEWA|nr:hypothetical protein NDU88_003731 [Pleurodeles waltl]
MAPRQGQNGTQPTQPPGTELPTNQKCPAGRPPRHRLFEEAEDRQVSSRAAGHGATQSPPVRAEPRRPSVSPGGAAPADHARPPGQNHGAPALPQRQGTRADPTADPALGGQRRPLQLPKTPQESPRPEGRTAGPRGRESARPPAPRAAEPGSPKPAADSPHRATAPVRGGAQGSNRLHSRRRRRVTAPAGEMSYLGPKPGRAPLSDGHLAEG